MKNDDDLVQDVVKAWHEIKNPKLRREAIELMRQLLESAEIERGLNNESEEASKEVERWDGHHFDNTTHYVLSGDSTDPKTTSRLKGRKAQLIFTSPPYNAGIQYDKCDDRLGIEDYKKFLEKSISVCDPILTPGGRFVVNIRDIAVESGSRLPIIVPLYKFFCEERHYKYRGVHIWYKGREESSTGWGSWRRSKSPAIIDLFEYVYVFQKSGDYPDGEDDLHKMEFIENVIGVWKIRPVKKIIGAKKTNIRQHPCPFPAELARRVIKLYSHVGDTVLDPFAGVLTTSIAAAECGRSSISIDISKKYCNAGLSKFQDARSGLLGFFGKAEVELL